MSNLFTALPYLPPSSFIFLPCIPLCMPSLGLSPVLARLSQQSPSKGQPREGRGRGARLLFVPAAGEARACRAPWWRPGDLQGQPCIPWSWRVPAPWELPG